MIDKDEKVNEVGIMSDEMVDMDGKSFIMSNVEDGVDFVDD